MSFGHAKLRFNWESDYREDEKPCNHVSSSILTRVPTTIIMLVFNSIGHHEILWPVSAYDKNNLKGHDYSIKILMCGPCYLFIGIW